MTARDPDLQRQIDVQVARLAAKVRLIAPLADPDGWARTHIEEMHADGWWPHLKSDRIPDRPPGSGSRTPWRAVIAERPCHRTAAHHRHTWTADGQGLVCPGLPLTRGETDA